MNRLILSLALVLGIAAHAREADAAEAPVTEPIGVTFKHAVAGGGIKIEYTVVNRSTATVFIFDGKLNRETGVLESNWSYIDVQSGYALLKRALHPTPEGALVEFPHAPSARELAPGARATGSFRVELPLRQSEPYGPEGRKLKTVDIGKLEVGLGWCPKSAMLEQMAEVKPVKVGDVAYWPFDFENIRAAQKIAKSAPVMVKIRGRAFVPR